MIRGLITVSLCVALAGCGGNLFGIGKRTGGKRASPETELPFKAKVTKGEQDVRDFSVSVANKGENGDAVRESVRYEGTKYCLYNNGSTDISWTTGEGDDWAFTQVGDALVFQGRCVGR